MANKKKKLSKIDKELVGVVGNNELSTLDEKKLLVLATEQLTRARMAAQLGQSYGGDRDLYAILGYPVNITAEQYWARYLRQDIAKRIIDAPVDGSWRKKPEIKEADSAEKETKFEKEWSTLVKDLNVYHHLARMDKLAGVESYSVLFLGFDDSVNGTPDQPVESAKNLIYIRPYSQKHACIKSFETDVASPRYGKPLLYTLTTADVTASTSIRTGTKPQLKAFDVHYTRILHVAEGTLEDDTYGTPKLENVYNRLQDLELVSGSSSEMFYQGAYPGQAFILDKDAKLGKQDKADLQVEIEEYIMQMKRYLRVQGMTVEQLEAQISDPKGNVGVLVSLISGGTGIPQRILIGSEQGELASSQDETQWNNKLEARREDFNEPLVLRPFIDRLMKVGVLTTVEEYEVEWPSLHNSSDKDKAEVAVKLADAISKYNNSPGAEMILPHNVFRTMILQISKEENADIEEVVAGQLKEEQDQMDEERRLMEEELERQRIADDVGGVDNV